MSRKSAIPHEISQNAIENLWPEFSAITKTRMVAGMRTYGDDSFHRPAQSLADEVLEEIVDIQGWSFILWCRVRALREKLAKLELEAENVDLQKILNHINSVNK